MRGAATISVIVLTALAAHHHHRIHPDWHPGAQWLRGAGCIHRHESVDWHISDPPYANGFQFLASTWTRAGGRLSQWVKAPPREQRYRAWRIWLQDGGSWREWSTASVCGLR